jgi:hypothetical protein
MLDYFFNHYGGEVMIDPVAAQNKSGQSLFKAIGFQVVEQPGHDSVLMKITKDVFNSTNK